MTVDAYWQRASSGKWAVSANWGLANYKAKYNFHITLPGHYTVSIDGPLKLQHNIYFDALGATLKQAAKASISLPGRLEVDAGTVVLNATNSFAEVHLNGGTLEIGKTGALGTGPLYLVGGTLLGVANVTVAPKGVFSGATAGGTLMLGGGSTIAAAKGTTLNFNPGHVTEFDSGSGNTLGFGAGKAIGTVLWSTVVQAGSGPSVYVNAGTLKAGIANFGGLLGAGITTIAKGATLDLHGHDTSAYGIEGAGKITSASAARLTLVAGAEFYGSISGGLSVDFKAVSELLGANSYTGDTLVRLALTIDGKGSLAATSHITLDAGSMLALDRTDAVTIGNRISGAGNISRSTDGTVTLAGANDFTGTVTINRGTIVLANAGALAHISALALNYIDSDTASGVRAAANVTLNAPFSVDFAGAFSATTGHTLVLPSTVHWTWTNVHIYGATIVVGTAGQSGKVVWDATIEGSTGLVPNTQLTIAGGTLTGGAGLAQLLGIVGYLELDAGATLDLNGLSISSPTGALNGTLTNTGALATLTLGSVILPANLTGSLNIVASYTLALEGTANYTGSTTIQNGGTLQIDGQFAASGAVTAHEVDVNGTLEKNANSPAVTDFYGAVVDGGMVDVQSGSIVFHNHLYYTGVIHGAISFDGGFDIVSGTAAGHDIWTAGTANSTIVLKSAPDSVTDSGGTDTVEFAASMTLKPNSISGIEAYVIDNGYKLDFSALAGGVSVTMNSHAGGKATVIGTNAADIFTSGPGKDGFTGKGGADVFVFNTAPSSANIDTFTDFKHHSDRFELDDAHFAALTGDWVHEFVAVKSGHKATTAAQHIIYDKSTGALWYDSDGKGHHAPIEFATFSGHPVFDGSDIFLI